MFNRRKSAADPVTVPDSTRRRAERAVSMGGTQQWIDQCLYLIGSNTTHHRPGDPMLDEAVKSAEALLAMLVAMRRMEKQDGL